MLKHEANVVVFCWVLSAIILSQNLRFQSWLLGNGSANTASTSERTCGCPMSSWDPADGLQMRKSTEHLSGDLSGSVQVVLRWWLARCCAGVRVGVAKRKQFCDSLVSVWSCFHVRFRVRMAHLSRAAIFTALALCASDHEHLKLRFRHPSVYGSSSTLKQPNEVVRGTS